MKMLGRCTWVFVGVRVCHGKYGDKSGVNFCDKHVWYGVTRDMRVCHT